MQSDADEQLIIDISVSGKSGPDKASYSILTCASIHSLVHTSSSCKRFASLLSFFVPLLPPFHRLLFESKSSPTALDWDSTTQRVKRQVRKSNSRKNTSKLESTEEVGKRSRSSSSNSKTWILFNWQFSRTKVGKLSLELMP